MLQRKVNHRRHIGQEISVSGRVVRESISEGMLSGVLVEMGEWAIWPSGEENFAHWGTASVGPSDQSCTGTWEEQQGGLVLQAAVGDPTADGWCLPTMAAHLYHYAAVVSRAYPWTLISNLRLCQASGSVALGTLSGVVAWDWLHLRASHGHGIQLTPLHELGVGGRLSVFIDGSHWLVVGKGASRKVAFLPRFPAVPWEQIELCWIRMWTVGTPLLFLRECGNAENLEQLLRWNWAGENPVA